MQTLNVWMNGELVGAWMVDRGTHTFRYGESWLQSPHRRALSLSLPISASLEIKGIEVKHYFDNLLPDNDKIRMRVSQRFKSKTDTFSLLQAIGRDCIGAVQLLPEDATPDGWNRIQCERLSASEVELALHAASSDDVFQDDNDHFRISIAGAQEKTALLRYRGQWCRPHGSTPTTHILKLPLGVIAGGGARVDFSDSVQNEWLCAQIMSALGLPTAKTWIDNFGAQTVLIVERFDRQRMDNDTWIARLPQEDFCQALGISPDMKYEKHGGPGMQQCLQLLQGSQDKKDTLFFVLTQLVFFLMAAPDGHAKNFSLFLQRGGTYEMTPLYDVLSAWPYIGNGSHQLNSHKAAMAMALRAKNAHYAFKEIHTRHWHQLAMKHGGVATWEAMIAMATKVEKALAKVEEQLPRDFPARTAETIFDGMRSEVKRFLSGADNS
ncbi:MAG: type II toxin-antitoxin system HipA family toxin [Burkholderiales bacterium]|nr:type II toxin-antitoxin system HipA family toxin [Burkholderiales bacterium]